MEKLSKLKKKEDRQDVDSGQESTADTDSEVEQDEKEDTDADPKLANEQISDMEYMKQLMKGTGERKPRQKMEKKVKEKITLFTLKVKHAPLNHLLDNLCRDISQNEKYSFC